MEPVGVEPRCSHSVPSGVNPRLQLPAVGTGPVGLPTGQQALCNEIINLLAGVISVIALHGFGPTPLRSQPSSSLGEPLIMRVVRKYK